MLLTYTHKDPGNAPTITHRWRDLSPSSLTWLYTQALAETSDIYLFSINFSKHTRDLMESSDMHPRDYIADRIRKTFNDTPLFFVIEYSPGKRRLHIHGALARKGMPIDWVKNGLKKVWGDKRRIDGKPEQFFYNLLAVDLRKPDWSKSFNGMTGPYGWSQYCVKDLKFSARQLGSQKSAIYCSRVVTHKSKKIHAESLCSSARAVAA